MLSLLVIYLHTTLRENTLFEIQTISYHLKLEILFKIIKILFFNYSLTEIIIIQNLYGQRTRGSSLRYQKQTFFIFRNWNTRKFDTTTKEKFFLLIRVAYRYIQFLSFSRLYCASPPILSILDVNGLADQHSQF